MGAGSFPFLVDLWISRLRDRLLDETVDCIWRGRSRALCDFEAEPYRLRGVLWEMVENDLSFGLLLLSRGLEV